MSHLAASYSPAPQHRLHVCMLIGGYWPATSGGTENQCRLLTHALSALGVRCTVVTTRPRLSLPRREMDGPVEIRRCGVLGWLVALGYRLHRAWPTRRRTARTRMEPGHGAATPRWLLRLTLLSFMAGATAFIACRRRTFSLLHVHTSEWIAGFAGWLGRRYSLPVLGKEAMEPVFPDLHPDTPFRAIWERHRLDLHVQATTPSMVSALRRACVPDDRIDLVPNGVTIPEGMAEPTAARTVLCVANLSQGGAHKGFDVLLEAWTVIAPQFPEWRLVLAGGGDPTPWKAIAPESVEFAGQHADLSALYRAAAIQVVASRKEGLSNALLEGQAWGLPAVVSDIGANTFVVRNGENGLIFRSGNARDLASRLQELMADPGRRTRMGTAARERMLAEFAIDLAARRLVEVYRRLTPTR